MRKSLIFGGAGIFLLLVFGYLFLTYGKLEATWGSVPVWMVAVGATTILVLLLLLLEWIRAPWETTPNWLYTAVVIGAGLCMLLGIYFTEYPERHGCLDGSCSSYDYTYSRSGVFYYSNVYPYWGYAGSSSDGSSGSHSSVSVNRDSAKALAILLILLVVIIMILLSAVIPHFWVVGALVCLGVAALLTLREFMYETDTPLDWEPDYRY